MALTESIMIELGSKAPSFTLPDTVTGNDITLHDENTYIGTLLLFICNHCPFVVHVQEELAKLGHDFAEKNIRVIAISSNDVENYPQDRPDLMKVFAKENNFNFPYLYDEDQSVAKAYDAACTPDIYLYDGDLKLYYRGRLDRSRPGNDIPVTGEDIRAAAQSLIDGESAPEKQHPSAGCNIKWK